jgi:hypothetical protein
LSHIPDMKCVYERPVAVGWLHPAHELPATLNRQEVQFTDPRPFELKGLPQPASPLPTLPIRPPVAPLIDFN